MTGGLGRSTLLRVRHSQVQSRDGLGATGECSEECSGFTNGCSLRNIQLPPIFIGRRRAVFAG